MFLADFPVAKAGDGLARVRLSHTHGARQSSSSIPDFNLKPMKTRILLHSFEELSFTLCCQNESTGAVDAQQVSNAELEPGEAWILQSPATESGTPLQHGATVGPADRERRGS